MDKKRGLGRSLSDIGLDELLGVAEAKKQPIAEQKIKSESQPAQSAITPENIPTQATGAASSGIKQIAVDFLQAGKYQPP